jgi:cytochrome c oxidase subunit 1
VLRRIFSTDHKVIGLQYGFTSMFFLLVGFSLVILIRWQHAFNGQALPFIGGLLGEANAPGGIISPEFYNQLGAMHGTIMVFLGVVPLAFGAFGNYVVPLQIGAPDMAFPRLNALSYWLFLAGGLVMLASFFLPGGAANNGWTSYAPLSDIAPGHGQTFWLGGMLLLIFSSLLGAMNFIATIIQLRAPGMTWFRLPVLRLGAVHHRVPAAPAFPALQAAAGAAGMDRLAGTELLPAERTRRHGRAIEVAGGGNALLWQHLFWFSAIPRSTCLILPAMGIIAR